MKIGVRLRQLRLAKNLSQGDIQNRLGEGDKFKPLWFKRTVNNSSYSEQWKKFRRIRRRLILAVLLGPILWLLLHSLLDRNDKHRTANAICKGLGHFLRLDRRAIHILALPPMRPLVAWRHFSYFAGRTSASFTNEMSILWLGFASRD